MPCYVFRAIDDLGQVIDAYVSPTRDTAAAMRFLRRAVEHTGVHPRTASRNSSVLDHEEGSQLATPLDREGPLNMDEQAELERLLARYGQLLRERRIQALARRRGISVEEAERERAERLAVAHAWWDAFDRDPGRDQALAEAAALRAQWPA